MGRQVLHLGYEVSAQCCVFCSHFRESGRNDVPKPLDLVDDGVSVRHVRSVRHSGLTELSDHSVNLLLDFLCWVKRSHKYVRTEHACTTGCYC